MKKLNKVMSVLLTLAIAASLFVVGAPASALSTGPLNNIQSEPCEQAWYGIDLPATYTYVVSGDIEKYPNYSDGSVQFNKIIKMVYNLDESAIYAIAEVFEGAPGASVTPATYTETRSTLAVFKTVNEGRTWTKCKTGFEDAIYENYSEFGCADIVASNALADSVYFTDGKNIYVTTDGGKTWVVVRDLYVDTAQQAAVADDTPIKTIDYIYSNGKEVLLAGTEYDVYILETVNGTGRWDKTQVFENHGIDVTAETTSVLVVKADASTYVSKQGVIALVLIGDEVILTKRYNQYRWNQTGSKDVVVTTTELTDIDGGSIWLPDDYATAGVAYASIHNTAGALNPVFRVTETASAYEFIDDTRLIAVTNVTGVGTSEDNIVVVGGAWMDDEPGAVVLHTEDGIYKEATINPIGFDWAYVLLLSNYAANGRALAGTAGGTDCGVSLTTDFCDTFIQISMIGEPLGRILDVAGDIYVLTPGILWRNISGYWERVKCTIETTSDLGELDLEVAADGTLYIAEVGARGDATPKYSPIYTSENNGLSFNEMRYSYGNGYPGTPVGVTAWYPISKSSLVVADNGYICVTENGGQKWTYIKNDKVGTVTDLIMVDGKWYAVAVKISGGKAEVTALSSTDGKTWTPSTVKKGNTDAEDGSASIAFAGVPYVVADFAMTDSKTGDDINQVYYYNGKKWVAYGPQVLGTDIVADAYGSGLDSEGTGMVYVVESNTVLRLRGTDGIFSDITEYLTEDGGFTAPVHQIWLTKSGTDNVLWAQNVDGVYKYIDTMNDHGTGLKADVNKISAGNYTIKFSWDAMDNAYAYVILADNVWSKMVLASVTDFDFANDFAGFDAGAIELATVTTLTEITIGAGASEVWYYNVWAIEGYSTTTTIHPVFSFAYANPNNKVGTPLAGPLYITPSTGYTYEQADSAQIVWMDLLPSNDDMYAAYDHELQIAVYDGNGDPNAALDKASTIFIPKANAVEGYDQQIGAGYYRYSYSPVLDYNTAYAVRVRAVTEDAIGEWSTIVFSTVENSPYQVGEGGGAAPVITVPTYTISVPPQVTVTEKDYSLVCEPDTLTVTVPTYTIDNGGAEKASTPIYIWVIIAIGAILCIAVIVLIVRTRRVA